MDNQLAMLPSEWIKTAVMSPLQQQVYELGTCAKCHTKTMNLCHASEGYDFWQCCNCLTVAILDRASRPATDIATVGDTKRQANFSGDPDSAEPPQ